MHVSRRLCSARVRATRRYAAVLGAGRLMMRGRVAPPDRARRFGPEPRSDVPPRALRSRVQTTSVGPTSPVASSPPEHKRRESDSRPHQQSQSAALSTASCAQASRSGYREQARHHARSRHDPDPGRRAAPCRYPRVGCAVDPCQRSALLDVRRVGPGVRPRTRRPRPQRRADPARAHPRDGPRPWRSSPAGASVPVPDAERDVEPVQRLVGLGTDRVSRRRPRRAEWTFVRRAPVRSAPGLIHLGYELGYLWDDAT